MKIDPKLLKSLLVLSTVIEARDHFTGGHVWRVAEYSKLLAEKLGLPKHEILKAYLGGYLHDIGKVGIPDAVLNKNSSLSNEEYNIIKHHPGIGLQIIGDHPLEELIKEAVESHHERLDGNGYPNGIGGDEIKVIPRIIAIADTFDAITSVRPYKKIIPNNRAIEILKKEEGTSFDSMILNTFISSVEAAEVDNIVGHSDFSRPLLDCPACGPMLPVHNNKKDGDKIECHACKGVFKLHSDKTFFEIEILNDSEPTYESEVDYVQIDRIIVKSNELI